MHLEHVRKNTQGKMVKMVRKVGSVIGLAVDRVSEACAKPEALTARVKENGRSCGLESGLYFIF